MHYTYHHLYAAKVLELIPYSPYGQFNYHRGCCNNYPVQRPLALLWAVLSHCIFSYYGLIRDSRPFCLISFIQRIAGRLESLASNPQSSSDILDNRPIYPFKPYGFPVVILQRLTNRGFLIL